MILQSTFKYSPFLLMGLSYPATDGVLRLQMKSKSSLEDVSVWTKNGYKWI